MTETSLQTHNKYMSVTTDFIICITLYGSLLYENGSRAILLLLLGILAILAFIADHYYYRWALGILLTPLLVYCAACTTIPPMQLDSVTIGVIVHIAMTLIILMLCMTELSTPLYCLIGALFGVISITSPYPVWVYITAAVLVSSQLKYIPIHLTIFEKSINTYAALFLLSDIYHKV